MAQKYKEYRKLPGLKKGFMVGRHTLWQGSDHLLQVYSRLGIEDYKRFYFSDIQAIITRKTRIGRIQNAILGGFIFLFTLAAISFEQGWSLFFTVADGVMLLFLLLNLLKGPTCETRLLTAVQTEKLHSLNRVKSTFKVMDRLRASIEAIQGNLAAEDLTRSPIRRNGPTASPAGPAAKAPKHEKGRAHQILFVLLLVDGALVSLGLFFTHVTLTALSSIISIFIGIFVIIALVKQHDSDMAGPLRAITWTSLGFVCVSFAAGYAVMIVFALKYPGIVYNQWEMLKSISSLSPWENPLKLSLDVFTLSGALFLGLPGLILLKQSQSRENFAAASSEVRNRRPLDARNPQPG